MQEIRKRLFKGFGANAFGQSASIFIQVVSVPIFLQVWGVELYGEWLILSTIPSYFAMSDIGFANVAANEMTMQVANKKTEDALETFQSSWLFISFTSIIIFLILLISIWHIPVEHLLNLKHQTHQQVVTIILLFTLHMLVKLQGGLLEAGFRCDGNYAFGVFASNVVRLLENLSVLTTVFMGGSPMHAALVFLWFRILGFILMKCNLRKKSPWINYGFTKAKLETIKRLACPAFAFMGFPLGYALINQGLYTVVSVTLNPVAVVTFSTLRTISRLAFQLMVAVNSTVWPEITSAYGVGNISLVRKLHSYSCKLSIWASSLSVLFLFFFGEQILRFWTREKIEMDFAVFYTMLAIIVINSIWLTSSVVPSATNKHQKISLYFVLSTILSIALASIITPIIGLSGTALSMLSVDLAMTILVVRTSLSLLDDTFFSFFRIIIEPPSFKPMLKKI